LFAGFGLEVFIHGCAVEGDDDDFAAVAVVAVFVVFGDVEDVAFFEQDAGAWFVTRSRLIATNLSMSALAIGNAFRNLILIKASKLHLNAEAVNRLIFFLTKDS
jgi:hypothetical protein